MVISIWLTSTPFASTTSASTSLPLIIKSRHPSLTPLCYHLRLGFTPAVDSDAKFRHCLCLSSEQPLLLELPVDSATLHSRTSNWSFWLSEIHCEVLSNFRSDSYSSARNTTTSTELIVAFEAATSVGVGIGDVVLLMAAVVGDDCDAILAEEKALLLVICCSAVMMFGMAAV
ncbi:unnamed protein product [Linum trigynum]|uniref:Uncharacterized protein n=1 Tax=Linum trigynum TaxID=586398 RepID=A0AAV2E896_9ROSI